MNNAQTGRLGEDFAAAYYEKIGYKILGRNVHSRFGEIDIIAQNDEYIVFAEVKTRGKNRIAAAREAVDLKKQRKIVLTAMEYISENNVMSQPRFDVFEVLQNDGKIYKFNLIENAFDLTDYDSWG